MRFVALAFSLLSTAKAAYDHNYFDNLRNDSSVKAEKSDANEDRLWKVTVDDTTFQLAQITAFLPFSDGTKISEGVEDDLAATLMAIYHFNNPEESPHLSSKANPQIFEDLKNCNIKLTAEFHDTRDSPIDSTRRFTQILQRENTFQVASPAGVIGAYRSAVTSPLAILTGVNEIPQISYASTSTDFDVKEQYPLFGRTIQSSTGEAQVALDFFETLGATHVGVLFVTDAFGSALQKAFQDAASEKDIFTDSVAFSYSADLNGDEIQNAVESLKKTLYRLFYVIAFDVHYETIMTAAYKQDLVGEGFLWIFDGIQSSTFHRNANYLPDSPLDKATRGVGLINVVGGYRPEIQLPNEEAEPKLEDDPITSYEMFRTFWRNTINDRKFTSYAQTRMPTELEEMRKLNSNYMFGKEPQGYTPFLYDAITGLGLAYCRAANGTTGQKFEGLDVFKQFANLDFDGATGRVKILSATGTRDYKTEHFMVLNVQKHELKDGSVTYKLVPTDYYNNSSWATIENNTYVYADGSTETPESLPPADVNMNYIGDISRAVGYTLMGIVVFGSVAAFGWLLWYRKERVVRSSQPLFLFMVAFGSLVMASSIVPLSLEEPVSKSGLDYACMAAPWLYLSGAVIVLSALLAKTRGVRRAYTNPDLDFIQVTSCDIFGSFFTLYLINFIVIITWQFIAPLEWIRIKPDSTDQFDRQIVSYGQCSNDDALPFAVVIVILNISILVVANWWSYQARNIETEYHESRYIGISMASILQAWCMGIPILIVVWDNPQAKFFVEAGIIFVTALAVLLLIFVPKILAIRTDRIKAIEESKRRAYTGFTARSRKNPDFEEDEKSKPATLDEISNHSATKASSEASPELDLAATGVVALDKLGDRSSAESHDEDTRPKLETVASTSAIEGSGRNILRIGLVESLTKTLRRRSSGAIAMNGEAGEGNKAEAVGGIRVTHNPRSAHNLEVGGGQEFSRAQLEHLKAAPVAEAVAEDEEDDNADLSNIREERDAEQGRTMPSQ